MANTSNPIPGTDAARKARYRKSKAAEEAALIEELNAKRAQLNLPPFTTKLPRRSLKGTKRPEYGPSTGMDGDELKQWRIKDRKRRKAAQQRETRKKKNALLKSMEEQLSILTAAIEHKAEAVEILPKIINAENLSNVADVTSVVKECADAPKFVPMQWDQVPTATLDSHISGEEDLLINDPLIDVAALLSDPLIHSNDIEAAILSDTSAVSWNGDLSIPIAQVFDKKDDVFATEAMDKEGRVD